MNFDLRDSLGAVNWTHGAADCAGSTDPALQEHSFGEDTWILRQSKCFSFEAPFMYMLFGEESVILFDTGAAADDADSGRILPLRVTVDRIIAQWQARRAASSVQLIVAHTHSHGDHVFWDSQFVDRADTTIVEHDLPAIMRFFGLSEWPEGEAGFDLGGRELTILPAPGHEPNHIAIHDARSGILLTGDNLYPGLLTVRDWPAYRQTANRLANFAARQPVSLVLGDHIEMKRVPREFYPLGTIFQPEEHALPLTAAHLEELRTACEAMGSSPHRDVHDDFIIEPL